MKRRVLSFLLALTMILPLSACGGTDDASEKATIAFPEVSAEREAVERAGAFAVDQYVYARMKTEALIEYDLKNGSKEELSKMVEETLNAWKVAEAAATGAEQIASRPESLEGSSESAVAYYASAGGSLNPFVEVAYAAEEDAATKWAKDITEKFDSYPANARIKGLAQDLGVDAKNAYKQLQMAQDILKGNAEAYEGDLYGAVENALIATRTVCKTTLYVAGTVASGGGATALEVGCMVIGGVDTVVDIATTGSTIIRGHGDSVTLTLNEVKDYLAPVSAVAGGIGFFTSGVSSLEKFSDKMGLLDKFTYVGDSLLDYFQDNKVIGIQLSEKNDAASMKITEIDTKDKSTEEITKAIKKAGLNFSEATEAKPASEIVSDMESERGGMWTAEAVQDYFNELLTALEQKSESASEEEGDAKSEPEANDPKGSDESTAGSKTKNFPGKIPAMEDILGTYHMIGNSDAGVTDLTFTLNIVLRGSELYAIISEDDQGALQYDTATGKATVKGNDSGSFMAFREQKGKIHLYYEIDWGNGVWWHLHSTD